jgi:hypothetical protein
VQPGRGLQQLADLVVRSTQAKGARPYVLVLGAGCPQAAKVPSLEELRETWGEDVDDPAGLEAILWSVEVPPFYYDIANLARAGYFPVVVTTGYDRLLERALVDLGLRPGDQFETVEPAAWRGRAPVPPPDADVRVVHAHGLDDGDPVGDPVGALDLGTGHEPGEPLETVLVGYQGESPSLDRWLGAAAGGDLWWANADDEHGDHLGPAGWRGEVALITGNEAVPSTFFGQLALMLLRLPAIDTLKQTEPVGQRGDAWYDREYTQSRLNQANTVKRAIESVVPGSSVDPARQSQLSYQQQEIVRLEQDLVSRDVVDRLLKRHYTTAAQLKDRAAQRPDSVDPDTLAFLDGQIVTLEREAAKPQPNGVVISAAEASLGALQDTLGIREERRGSAS